MVSWVRSQREQSLVILQGIALLPFQYHKGLPTFPFNITRDYPPSLLILKGIALLVIQGAPLASKEKVSLVGSQSEPWPWEVSPTKIPLRMHFEVLGSGKAPEIDSIDYSFFKISLK